MRSVYLVATMAVFCSFATSARAADPAPPELEHRWVYVMANLARDEVVEETIELAERAKRAGYNGLVLSDSKLFKPQLQPESYAVNVRKLRAACAELGMKLILAVAPIGYAAELLAADPNLAEGMPVRGAPFVVRAGELVPHDDGAGLANGALDQWKGDQPLSWSVDKPGTVSFRDERVRYEGRPTLRQDHTAAAGAGSVRLIQRIKVEPWRYYHLSVMAKTEDCTSKDFRLFAMSTDPAKGFPLNWQPPAIEPTMDWRRLDATFTTADNTEISIYIGSYNVKRGRVWWSDVRLEPGGFVNVIRRASLPVAITSDDGRTTFAEGKDYTTVVDPRLGHDPNPGYFTVWHEAPAITIPAGSRMGEGRTVRATYHFATPVGKSHQVNCCLAEPKIYELLEKQIGWVEATARPDGYMLAHDEIRHSGWDDSCTRRGLSCGELLAENIKKCVALVGAVAPGRPVMTWSDMFDPFHNAHREGWMYLARGDGPWYGSWEGLPREMTVVNWHQQDADSLRFFAERNHAQVLAGFYDADPARIADWLRQARAVDGVRGVMYTTWVGDYTQLEKFIEHVRRFEETAASTAPSPEQ